MAGDLRFPLLLLLLSLVACGPLPRPFQPQDKSQNALVRLNDGASIFVAPLQLDQPGPAEAAAAALAAALRARNLPASHRHDGSHSRRLTGWASLLPAADGQEEILFQWELQAPGGERGLILSQRAEAAAGAWRAGEPAVIEALMAEAAAAIAAQLQPETRQTAAVPGFPGARIVVAPPLGAPGDGNRQLARAMTAALSRFNLPLAERPARGDLLLTCRVELGPAQAHWQKLRVTWSLNRAVDGQELGRLDQANPVPISQLNGPWAGLAEAIARDAAQGLLDLVTQLAEAGPARPS